MSLPSWERLCLSARPDLSLPKDYVVLDLETTGLSVTEDIPTQLGYVRVRNCQAVDCVELVVNWTDHPSVHQPWLRERLDVVAAIMAEKNGQCLRFEDLRNGDSPEEVFSFVGDLLLQNQQEGGALVGHNIVAFDMPMLANTHQVLLEKELSFGEKVYDTGIMEKAVGLKLPVRRDETLLQYARRVKRAYGRGVKWGLGDCVRKYGLDSDGVNLNGLHGAGEDSFASHLLFERHRA